MHRIVIVGGGAGGLALATQLGKQLGKKNKAHITLVDSARTHVWKPLFHQLAAGSFDTHAEEIEYLAQARWNHFKFRLGSLTGIDRANKTVQLAASHDALRREITPAQSIEYDTLVIAVGSQTNDFGTLGAAEHTIKLDTPAAAKYFNARLVNACLRAQTQPRVPGKSALTVQKTKNILNTRLNIFISLGPHFFAPRHILAQSLTRPRSSEARYARRL